MRAEHALWLDHFVLRTRIARLSGGVLEAEIGLVLAVDQIPRFQLGGARGRGSGRPRASRRSCPSRFDRALSWPDEALKAQTIAPRMNMRFRAIRRIT